MEQNQADFIQPVLSLTSRCLHWQFDRPLACLSWSLYQGQSDTVCELRILQVRSSELGLDICPKAYIQQRLLGLTQQDCLVFLTSACLDDYGWATQSFDSLRVASLVTLGLGNALAAGDPAYSSPQLGTINIASVISTSLSPQAQLEALAIGVEAKVAVLQHYQVPSTVSSQIATGTGTDCHAILSQPTDPSEKAQHHYAGKHTVLGQLVGSTVRQALELSLRAWALRHRDSILKGWKYAKLFPDESHYAPRI